MYDEGMGGGHRGVIEEAPWWVIEGPRWWGLHGWGPMFSVFLSSDRFDILHSDIA